MRDDMDVDVELDGDALGARHDDVDVSVLVPVLNEARYLRTVVPAMLAQEFDGTIEFLLIDGGSSDGSPEIIRELAAEDERIRFLRNPAQRTPHALNIGLRHARGRFVARMDAHTFYPGDYLASGVARLRAGGVVSVSGPMLATGTDVWSRRIALALRTRLGVGGARFRLETEEEVEVDSGFTGMWARDTLIAAGGWDEEWINDQDFELAARLRKGGGRIVCLQAMAASYIPRNSLRAVARQYFRYGFYRVKTSVKHPESLRRSQLLPPGLVVVGAASVVPTPARRAARAGVGLYTVAILATMADAARRAPMCDVAWLLVVLPTMHLSYGIGTIAGSFRFGVPIAALARAATIGRPATG